MTEIRLDITLRDLYALGQNEGEEILLVNAVPIAEIQMSKGIPPSSKFAYQSPLLPTKDKDVLAREFLQLASQLLAFIAGGMPLVLFDLDWVPEEECSKSSMRQHQADAHGVFDRLISSQRPKVTFVGSPSDILYTEKTKVALINPMDCMEVLPQLIPPEFHYKVLSKRTLAFSGLPTPKSTVLDVKLDMDQLSRCEAVADEVERMMCAIEAHHIPFIVKLPQSLSGQGTFIIRNEAERRAAIKILRPEARRMLRQITAENIDLRPCSLILQEMVPGEATAVSFFVSRDGKAIFNACCPQLVDYEGNWGGNYVDYRVQDDLALLYGETIAEITSYLHANNYWGPAGADIITDQDGKQLVIDMNVRVTGSHPLGPLRGFFQERGFVVATLLFPFAVNGTRAKFEAAFRKEFEAGSIVINAWVHMREGITSLSTITLAATNEENLHQFKIRVQKWGLHSSH
jgi:hypothetical protein